MYVYAYDCIHKIFKGTVMVRIGFDIGGTFTDLAIAIEGKPLVFHKVPSTSPDPAQGVLHGLDDLLARTSVNAEDIRSMLHATTVATNAILERKGAKTAHVASEGFRDIIIIGRQKRYDIFDLYLKKPKPLVERKDVFEVS